ncbi:extracellular solute-binding protein [Clostridium oryzae]|uniref:Lipoprotein LipO n=1 Tax=Clostridium oryzae TaxID=1450648 RepID=A0A1V4IJV1_9CLOT|nr:extracellular solute-binding protein [Clostridium oryzae]OPJ60025.1 lipoprotein LipO precursor [Clostridium oryzae]
MKNRALRMSVILMTAMMAVSLIGCKSSKDTSESKENVKNPALRAAMTTPYGKYPQTVKYTVGITAANYGALKGTPYKGDNDSNNAWTRYAKKKLNVKSENTFVANNGDDYNQKVSMAIVSGKIPDIMCVSDYDTLKQLYENGLIADLSNVYKTCASEKIKDIYDSYGNRCLDTARFDGKLMALPTTEISHGPGVLWLRKDWMDKLGLADPKTIDDVENILQQFSDKNPGGNAQGKTVGLVVSNKVAGTSGGAYMVNNIFSLYGAFPQQWLNDGTGKAVYGSIQPQMKTALGKLSEMYSKGLIDKQFAVRTTDDCKALLTSGKSGAVMDNWWGSWTVADTLKLNPKAKWVPYVAPVAKDDSLTMFTGNPNSSYVVVRKGYKHPELAMKLASLQFDYERYEDKNAKSIQEINDYNKYNVGGGLLATNIDYYDAFVRQGKRIQKALETGKTSGLNNLDMSSYNSYKTYLQNVKAGKPIDSNAWAGYTSSIKCAQLVANSKIKEVKPIFFGNTASMSLKWPTLSKMELEMYLKIITGEQSVSSFDTFVDRWKKAGGEQITQEVNKALTSK